MTVFASDLEIADLVRRFEARAVTESEWTHAAHLAVALHYCAHHPAAAAFERMRAGIFGLNEAHGTPNTETRGYHETLTRFWILYVRHFLDERPGRDLASVANEMTKAADSGLPLRHYSRELLFSPLARREWVEPDLAAIPPVVTD